MMVVTASLICSQNTQLLAFLQADRILMLSDCTSASVFHFSARLCVLRRISQGLEVLLACTECWRVFMYSTNESLLDMKQRHHRHYYSYHREHICRRLGDGHPQRRRSSWNDWSHISSRFTNVGAMFNTNVMQVPQGLTYFLCYFLLSVIYGCSDRQLCRKEPDCCLDVGPLNSLNIP